MTIATVADAVLAKVHAPVEWLGIVHVLWGYERERERWTFFCRDAYEGDAHAQRISEDPITCILCKGLASKHDETLVTSW